MKCELVLRRKDLLNTYRCIPCHVLLRSDKTQIKSINRNKKKFPFNKCYQNRSYLIVLSDNSFCRLLFALASFCGYFSWWSDRKKQHLLILPTDEFAANQKISSLQVTLPEIIDSNYDVFSHWPKQVISSQIATITCTILIY